MDKILELIQSGKDEGAVLQAGGVERQPKGYYVKPTVFSDVKDGMRIATEEILVQYSPFSNFKPWRKPLIVANATSYGLAAGILTKNMDHIHTFTQRVRAGSVWVNCYDYLSPQTPFGGFKQSGYGRELGPDGLQSYLETKLLPWPVK
ncbi:Uncharacterized protein FKW44_000703 [Caligus rogercresseyi]|uniref:Aldehyde dehydrogenase domain-containing protein n=1 Tax=Caligus rogercresseyi TaxID=217165 RepID=A0A7T8KHU9_CALRO|nr:Uncharacterized protein FKW44_000703 [Caligus rogercresseyi]